MHYSIIRALDYKSIKNQISFHRVEMYDHSLISVIFIRFIALSYLGARLCFETKLNILLDRYFFVCFRFEPRSCASVASLFYVFANYLVFDIPIFSRSAMRTFSKCFIKRRKMSEMKRQLGINTSAIIYTRWLPPWQDYIGSLNHWCSRIECPIINKVATGFLIFLFRHCTYIIYMYIQHDS